MDTQLRNIEPDEFETWHRVAERMFGSPVLDPRALADERTVMPVERMLAVFDGGEIVGTAAAYDFELTVPGGAVLPAAGVTAVTVATTHRRRGLLTQMMRAQLDDIAARGEPFAVLNASETAIYGRYGYGAATLAAMLEIDRRFGAFVRPPATGGALRFVDRASALEVVRPVYERYRLARPGALSRSDEWWALLLGDRRGWKGGGPANLAVHEGADGPDGYVLYSTQPAMLDPTLSTVEVRELVAADPEVEAALWRHCLDVDLATRVRVPNQPLDSAVRWRLVDSRQLLTTRVADVLWLRIVDPVTALQARHYARDGVLVFDVDDPFRPETSGRYRLDVRDGLGSCERTEDAADVALGIDALGALYLGGVPVRTLASARRVTGERDGAVARADALFATDVEPCCITPF